MSSFYRTLNFTSANEDGRTELAALSLSRADRVLCLTASGARPLDLLLGDPGEVVALDLNPAQNHLLALKIAAYATLSNDDLYAYLGLTPCSSREALHARVETALAPESLAFWAARRGVIRAGAWYAGRWERVLRFGAFGTRLVRGVWIDRMFRARSLEMQNAIWMRHFDDWIWRGAIRVLSQRWFWTRVVGEPGGAFLPDARATEARLAGAFNDAARRFYLRDSDFASLILRGRHDPSGALPLHLMPENIDVVRARLGRIRIETGGLADLSAFGRFDAFSLSDFGSYCSQADYDACWRGVIAAAQSGARFCERVFMNPLRPSADLAESLAIDVGASERLTRGDRAIIYDIRAGVIRR